MASLLCPFSAIGACRWVVYTDRHEKDKSIEQVFDVGAVWHVCIFSRPRSKPAAGRLWFEWNFKKQGLVAEYCNNDCEFSAKIQWSLPTEEHARLLEHVGMRASDRDEFLRSDIMQNFGRINCVSVCASVGPNLLGQQHTCHPHSRYYTASAEARANVTNHLQSNEPRSLAPA